MHFKCYLEGTRTQAVENKQTYEPFQKLDQPMVYVKKWMKTRHATLLRLSNRIVQVCFNDKTEIILSSQSKMVTY